MRQAKEMQKKMQESQEKLANTDFEGNSGGGLVKAVVNGTGTAKKIEIDDSLIKIDEKDILEDLIIAAINDAKKKADESSANSMGDLTGGMNLPSGFKLQIVKYLTIIPARLASTRLPNKPLADICGKKMIQRVYEQGVQSDLGEVYIACDSQEVKNLIEKIGGKAILTDPDLPSGTDRIYQALQKIPNKDEFDFIINLQGDLPIIDPEIIKKTANLIANSSFDIATIAVKIENESDIKDPNIVKVAIANLTKDGGKALYFSRSAIPYGENSDFYEHIGIYVYKKSALEKFVQLEPSNLERLEKLEQLRALENNMTIAVAIADSKPISIDTESDLQKAKKFL